MAKSGRPKTTNSAAVTTGEVKNTSSEVAENVDVKEIEVKEIEVKPDPKPEETPISFTEKKYIVINEKMAGKSVTGSTGEIITFDDSGKAIAGIKDAEHLSRVPGYSIKEK